MDQTTVPKSPGGRLMAMIGRIGSDARDTAEERLQKTLLVALTLTMSSLAIIWGSTYAAFGEYGAAAIPWSYAAISFASTMLFGWIRRYRLFRFSQLLFALFLPFLLMIELGGFIESSAVVLWSLTAPLGALIFSGRRDAGRWFAAYAVLVVLGAAFEAIPHARSDLPQAVITALFVMNIVGVSGVAMMLLQYFIGERNLAMEALDRKHRWIMRAFSSYVSPNLVRYLIDHPDGLRLGGERRVCSFVLTDLADFTPLVEKTDPEIVVSKLNAYLEAVTEIIFAHDGTIDRIVGDSVSVMFSAPVTQPDHAARAVSCALALDAFAEDFGKARRETGLAFGATRIGVHSGPVIVGNVGSAAQLDYRALGDTINTAARLESANRHLGTRVLLSGTTLAGCPDLTARPVGTLLLKGKTEGIETFEPVAAEADAAGSIDQYRAAYARMASNAPDALESFEALSAASPDDRLVAFHLNRLRSGESGDTIAFSDK
jgi:class 3 adenylate cyclase